MTFRKLKYLDCVQAQDHNFVSKLRQQASEPVVFSSPGNVLGSSRTPIFSGVGEEKKLTSTLADKSNTQFIFDDIKLLG